MNKQISKVFWYWRKKFFFVMQCNWVTNFWICTHCWLLFVVGSPPRGCSRKLCCTKLWNQVPSLDNFVVQNSGDFLYWKYRYVVWVFLFLCFKLETKVSSALIHSTLLSSWLLSEQQNTQPIYIFNRVRVLHLDRLKEGTWLHSFGKCKYLSLGCLNSKKQAIVQR